MDVSINTGREIDEPIIQGLKDLIGSEHVDTGPDAAAPFLRPCLEAPGLKRVSPGCTEDVQAIVNLARENGVALVTCNDHILLPEERTRNAILLDFSRMNRIEKIDTRNLVAHVERGVTWEQLNQALKKNGLKTVAPVAANSAYPVECIVARSVAKFVTKFPDYALMNMKVVRADGEVLKTGTHALNEEAADGRNEGGPNLSQWHVGADDIFGVVTRATIMLWPVCESRAAILFGFEHLGEMLTALQEIPRTELGLEYLGINRAAMHRLLGEETGFVAPWTLVVGFEGREKLVAHHRGRVTRLLADYPCRPVEEHTEAIAQKLDEPWMEASPNHTAFFSRFSRFMELDGEASRAAEEAGVATLDEGKIIVSVDRGRAVHAVYDWFCDEDRTDAVTRLNLSLAGQGAFFDRPHGPLARKIYTNLPNHLPLLKHIKGFQDPANILNPGRTISEEDTEWQPLKVREGEIGLTVDNLKEVLEKLRACVGDEWASDNPVDVGGYGRDFTIFSGERPNIVVMPETTEQIQEIVRIAYAHGIPLVPQTTGFNHGGLTVSRKGGILMDLRRMDQTCVIDQEAMTVTVSPAVRMRSVWWEAIRHKATEGVHLKPILPLTLGSISLLSNYVARGAPGTTAKHGTATELTVRMKWVLPNGEILEIGPGAVPGVGNLPLHYCPGPEINGMFFNADGQFGICTELTAKLYPEYDNVTELEEFMTATTAEPDAHKAFEAIIDATYDVARENITEFLYKGHPGTFALGIAAKIEGTKVMDLINMAPRHPLAIIFSGYDEEEIQIKKEILTELMEKHGMFMIDVSMFGPELAEMISTEPLKMSLGVKDNFAGAYKGAFQWTAAQVKMDILPHIAKEYERLVEKYWKTSDPRLSLEHAMTDTALQGPLPYGRCGPCEFDYWWDQGNPEDVKRATTMIHKTNKLLLKYGAGLWRNMFGAGEYHLPMWGKYFEVLKQAKNAFDPANLMHPDVLPLTDDYI